MLGREVLHKYDSYILVSMSLRTCIGFNAHLHFVCIVNELLKEREEALLVDLEALEHVSHGFGYRMRRTVK